MYHCITDAITFINHGDWWFPDGNRLPQYNIFARDVVYEVLGPKRVDLRRRDNSGTPPSGLYHCDIPTGVLPIPIGSAMRKRVYVGLYANGGG